MRKLKNFRYFMENNVEDPSHVIHYYCFDIDDNLIKADTKIHMEKLVDGKWEPIDVSSEQFAQVRNDKENYRLADEAFSEFRDNGPRGKNAFLEDFKKAINSNSFAPSWSKFIKCLVDGNIFALITARGHAPETFKEAVRWVIYNYLSDSDRKEMVENLHKYDKLFTQDDYSSKSDDEIIDLYLDNCDYYGVSSPEFLKIAPGGAGNPEKGKEIAIDMFAKKVNDYSKQINRNVKLGFSDDDIRNVDHIEKYMRDELSLKYPIKMSIIDTSKGVYNKRRVNY